MEERYHATTQNRFYPDMSNVNKNITVEAKLISPPTYNYIFSVSLLNVAPFLPCFLSHLVGLTILTCLLEIDNIRSLFPSLSLAFIHHP